MTQLFRILQGGLMLISSASFAQSDSIPQPDLSIKEAFELARQNYPSIKLKLAAKESAHHDLSAAQNNFLPNFLVQGQVLDATSNQVRGTYISNGGLAIPVSGSSKVNGPTNDVVWSSFATGMIDWRFFSFGKFKASVDAAKAGATAAEADYQNEMFQQMIKVGDAYLLTLIAEDMLTSQNANFARVKTLREVTISYARSGIKPGVDSSLVNAEYSKAKLQLLEAQRIVLEQKVYLKEQLGIRGPAQLNLDATLLQKVSPELAEPSSPAANPRLLYFKSIVDLHQAKVTAIKRRELPSLSFLVSGWARGSGISDRPQDNGNFNYNSSFGNGVVFRAYDYMLGVSTAWNFTSLFKTGNEAKAELAVTHMASERYNEEVLRVEAELERARLRYEVALETSKQAPLQLTAAQDAHNQSRARYNSGLSTILELTQTFALLNRAEVDVAIARGNVWRAILQYAAASGNFELFTKNLN